eukprot:1234981-Prorocentrum_lima.AAC.1
MLQCFPLNNGQSAEHKAEEQAIGRKHMTKKRPKNIAPGNDDCGGDTSSILVIGSEDCPYDLGAP